MQILAIMHQRRAAKRSSQHRRSSLVPRIYKIAHSSSSASPFHHIIWFGRIIIKGRGVKYHLSSQLVVHFCLAATQPSSGHPILGPSFKALLVPGMDPKPRNLSPAGFNHTSAVTRSSMDGILFVEARWLRRQGIRNVALAKHMKSSMGAGHAGDDRRMNR